MAFHSSRRRNVALWLLLVLGAAADDPRLRRRARPGHGLRAPLLQRRHARGRSLALRVSGRAAACRRLAGGAGRRQYLPARCAGRGSRRGDRRVCRRTVCDADGDPPSRSRQRAGAGGAAGVHAGSRRAFLRSPFALGPVAAMDGRLGLRVLVRDPPGARAGDRTRAGHAAGTGRERQPRRPGAHPGHARQHPADLRACCRAAQRSLAGDAPRALRARTHPLADPADQRSRRWLWHLRQRAVHRGAYQRSAFHRL